jgi:hypothetical protein
MTIKSCVDEGGGIYVGIQEGEWVETSQAKLSLCPDLVLFNSKTTGTTLALPASSITPELVRKKIADSDGTFAKWKAQWKTKNEKVVNGQ